MTDTILAQVRGIYPQVVPQLLQKPNVVACGIGYKVTEQGQTDQLSLVVSVVRKLPKSELTSQALIPSSVDGMVTDVVETGKIRALMPGPTDRYRPAQPGISIGHYQITAGTFGLLVRRRGELFIISNNHVLANSNAAQAGDLILQPGPADGGTTADRIATLAEFVPLDFGQEEGTCSIAQTIASLLNALANLSGSSHRLQAVQMTAGRNLMDVALARPDSADLVSPQIMNIGLPTGVAEPTLGLAIQKMGRTTGLTQGTVQQIDVTVNVDYHGQTAHFTDQVIAGRMSSPGDSGSSILDMQRRVVGLLFAGSDQVTIFTPIQTILDRLELEVITG